MDRSSQNWISPIPISSSSWIRNPDGTHKGLFTYNTLLFGVASAPSIFQRVMESVLQGIPGVCTYIDDILVTGQDEQQHLDHLEEVLRRLREAGMRLKKCLDLLLSVDYLGHMINAKGLRTSDTKVEAILQAPAPRNIAELRSFLGLVNYYGKFLPDLATVLLSPLFLLQKETGMDLEFRPGRSFPQGERAFEVVMSASPL